MPLNFLGLTLARTATAIPTGAEAETPPPGPFDRHRGDREIGAVGTKNYAGFLDQEEYNADLKGSKAIDVYTKMMASDSMVAAMLRSIVLPLRGAIPKFEPASDDPQDVHIAKACEEALLNMKGQLWDDFMRQAFTGTLGFGHSVFEQVYTDREGKPNVVEIDVDGKLQTVIAPFKLAPRLQRTLYRWPTDRNGDLVGIVQRVFVSDLKPDVDLLAYGGDANAAVSGGTYRYIPIPMDRLMVFTLEQEGSNFLGRSILRSAYRDYFMKNTLLNIQAIGFERHFVGTPYALVKQGIRQDEENAIATMLQTLRSHEKSFAIANEAQLADHTKTGMNPLGFLDMPSLGTSARAILDAIKYHDQQMAQSILADFLTLANGTGSNASNAMHRDKSSLFFNSLQGVKRPFEDSYQMQIVVPFVDLNFGPQKKYPKFGLTSLETKDIGMWGRGLALMAQAGMLTPDPTMENQLREMMDLPLLPTDEAGDPVYPEGTHLPPMNPGNDGLPDGPLPVQPKTPPPAPGGHGEPRSVPLSERHLADPPNEDEANRLQQQLAAALLLLALRLQDERDDFDVTDFTNDGVAQLGSGYLEGFTLGAGAINYAGQTWAQQRANDQRQYLEKFARDIEAGAALDEIDQRAALYASPVWEGLQRGTVDAMPSGGRIIWHAEGDAGTCELCDARDGETYTEDTLPGFPGEGDFGELCDGAINCRCWLEYYDGPGSSNNAERAAPVVKVAVLAEARCWRCKERGRPARGTLLGKGLNAGAQAYCSNCRQLVEVKA